MGIPFIDSIMGDSPEPTRVGIDQGTANLEAQQAAKAGQPASYFSGMLNQNTDKAGQLGQTAGQSNQMAARLGGNMNPNQFQAIRQAYGAQAQQGINQLKNQNEMQGQLMKADYMGKLSHAMLGQQQQQVNQYQFLTQSYMQQEQARAQTINSLFQVGDQVIGMNAKMGGMKQAPNQALDVSNSNVTSGMNYNLEPSIQTNYGQYRGVS